MFTSLNNILQSKSITLFSRQLSAMLSAGLPLSKSLSTLSIQTENKKFKSVLEKVVVDVESGKSFAEALGSHALFSRLYCSMVAVGEMGGNLSGMLADLSRYLEKQEKIRRKILTAVTYPAVIFSVSIAVLLILLTFVIPSFSGMFLDINEDLPGVTRAVITLSQGLSDHFIPLVLGVLLVLAVLIYLYTLPANQLMLDKMLLSFPLIGGVVRKSAIARFANTLGTLLHSGVPIIQAMQITAQTASNKVVESAVLKSLGNIESGKEIAGPLKETHVFPPMVIQMVTVGEETGALPTMLLKVSEFYEDEVDAAVERLTAILEPVMIIGLGILVAGLLLAVYLPLFEMIGNVQ